LQLKCSALEMLKRSAEAALGVPEIVALIDVEIAQLEQARAALAGITETAKAAPAKTAAAKTGKKKRNLSAEGRKRIADAMKKRWADRKKAASAS
jgi:hypothetical protein